MSEVDFELLKDAGLTEYEARVYVALLRYGSMEGPAVAEKAEVPKTRVYDSLRSLAEKGLASKVQERPMKFSPIEPEKGLDPLYRKKVDNLEHKRNRAMEVLEGIEGEREIEESIESKVDIVLGEEKMFEQLTGRIGDAKDELLLFVIGRKTPKKTEAAVGRAVKNGIDVKIVTARYDEENADFYDRGGELGVDVRYYDTEPGYAFGVIDRETVMLNITDEEVQGERMTIFLESEGLAGALSDYFEGIWDSAMDIRELEPAEFNS
ncbi:MAG: TrmB family transcriptional regulator [Candidatus Nanohaloarchaea archaeon]